MTHTVRESAAGRLGLLLPNRGVVLGEMRGREILDLARAADQADWCDAVWVGDSILAKPRLDSVATLSAIAGATERVRLGPACFASFPLRNALEVAFQWAALDQLSDGRAVFVPCIGGGGRHYGGHFDKEFKAFGRSHSDRVRIFEENLEIVTRLWAGESVTVGGDFNALDDVSLAPLPVQKGGIPTWIASNPHIFGANRKITEKAFRRVIRMSTGLMTAVAPHDKLAESLEIFDSVLAAEGKSRNQYDICVSVAVHVSDDTAASEQAATQFLNEYYMTEYSIEEIRAWGVFGSPQRIAEYLAGYEEMGVNHVIIRPAAWEQRQQFDAISTQVIAALER